jgi:phenylalanyl-tRNA synthetase beta chain
MPNTYVIKRVLTDMLGKEFTNEEFEDLCFEFGLEVEFTDTNEMKKRKEAGEEEEAPAEEAKDAKKAKKDKKDKKKKQKEEEKVEPVYKVEVPANRYDLLSVEGIALALKAYLGLGELPEYKIKNPEKLERIKVLPETQDVRPYCVSAIVRNVTFDEEAYNSFIDLQDLLHQNVCRRRKLVAMGTHDYDNFEGPITYEARKPEDIKFVPLNETKEMDGNEFMAHCKGDKYIKEYLPIIEDKPRYPIFYDKNGVVLSLPPIKNSAATAMSVNTKNVFIEITATDHNRARIVLDILTTHLSQYSADKYCIEQVEVEYPDGSITKNPTLEENSFDVTLDYATRLLGLDLTVDQIDQLLKKMSLRVTDKTEESFTVKVPVTRNDILHACDIAEDIGIAFGYNNIPTELPKTNTTGRPLPKNKFTDLLRQELAQASFIECLNMGLISKSEVFEGVRKEFQEGQAVKLANSKTIEFNYVRNSLMPGLLKTLHTSMKEKLPHKVFEIQDTVHIDPENENGASNKRTLCVMHSHTAKSGIDVIHGILDLVMLKFNIFRNKEKGYDINLSQHPTFLENMQVEITFKGQVIGHFGIVHPEVLKNFKIKYPVCALEMHMDEIFEEFENNA